MFSLNFMYFMYLNVQEFVYMYIRVFDGLKKFASIKCSFFGPKQFFNSNRIFSH